MINDTLQSMFDLLLSRAPGKTLAVLPADGSDVEFAIDESVPAYNQKFCSQEVTRLDSSADHRRVLREAFENAKNLVFVVSPFMTCKAIEADQVDILVARAVGRGVKVVIVTDSDLNKDPSGEWKENFIVAKRLLETAGAFVKIVSPIHNKTLCVDRVMISEGSYNWLSAVRTNGSQHKRLERSIMYCGKGVAKMIKDAIREVGGIDQCNGGGSNLKGDKAQKASEKRRYFHFNKKHPAMLGAMFLISILVGTIGQKGAGLWWIGLVFFLFTGLMVLYDYLSWNSLLNEVIEIGASEKRSRELIKNTEGGSFVDVGNDVFWDPTNAGLPYNAYHKK